MVNGIVSLISLSDIYDIYISDIYKICIYTIEYYSTIEKNEVLPFAATWMDLEGIMLSEINQTEKDKYCIYHLHVEAKKIQQTSIYNKKETDSQI